MNAKINTNEIERTRLEHKEWFEIDKNFGTLQERWS